MSRIVVVGSGVAGLVAALEVSRDPAHEVTLVTKARLAESNTRYAQGGIAAVMFPDDSVGKHIDDTLEAGAGLCDRDAVEVLCKEGPARIRDLIAIGVAFDKKNGQFARGLEGAHSYPRVLHAGGDATGLAIETALIRAVREAPITALEHTFACDLVLENGHAAGLRILDESGVMRTLAADAVVLASGGAGNLYPYTTNPSVATGDGIALAFRAGAVLGDVEFYQFHPTAFSMKGAPRFLLSEALRGEGAYLVNERGERFMERYHPLRELAPRDVVARAITHEGMDGEVYLDMRHVKKDLQARFPGISKFLAKHRLELGRDQIPVRPAAHYLMGGVRTDVHGRTSLPGLYAAGEVACTGVHGANRLASNSLLEGLVFGVLAAEAMMADGNPEPEIAHAAEAAAAANTGNGVTSEAATERWIAELRGLMWKYAGLLRDANGLREAQRGLEALAVTMPRGIFRRALEARNLHTVAGLIVAAALGREESRGAHYRNDFPERDGVARHSVMVKGKLSFVK